LNLDVSDDSPNTPHTQTHILRVAIASQQQPHTVAAVTSSTGRVFEAAQIGAGDEHREEA
jgi:hypothetical protein